MHNVSANGAKIPAIGFGTWTLKGDVAERLVGEAIAAGYRHIDTASMYDNEGEVGAGIAGSRVDRDDIFVTTKVWPSDIAPGDLEKSVETSLKKLRLEQMDLVLIHWPNPDIPLDRSMNALCNVKTSGLSRHIGVANFTTTLLDDAVRLAAEPLVCNQVEYHPYLNQDKVLAACRRHKMAFVSYCPLGRGGDVFREPSIRQAADRLGKTAAQIVLRWQVQQSGVVAIPRTSKTERLAENLAIFDFELSEEEMAAIGALSARHQRLCDLGSGPAWD